MKNNRPSRKNNNEGKINRKFEKSRFMKKNKRLGGKGLSLETFANAKIKNPNYNPALIKKHREFYKNAKYVSKYQKSLKQSGTQSHLPEIEGLPEDEDETRSERKMKKKKGFQSLREEYEKRREEEDKARMEREAIIQAKKEERERAEVRRKALREKMFKKTRSGQPVMKYRIEHILQGIQSSTD